MADRRAVTLITGASAGIGMALARVFARNGHDLMLVARREARLAALADEIAAEGRRRPSYLALDLERGDAARRIADAMAQLGVEPDTVVNNAGFGLLGPAAERSRPEQIGMIDVNVRALTDLSLAFVDSLAHHRGGILNVASVAAFMPGPRMAVYFATKAYVLSFGKALHWELKPRGIRVCTLCPGPVPTEFQARAGYVGDFRPDILTQSPEAVAEAAYRGLQQGRSVVVPGVANRLVTAFVHFVPQCLLMGAIERHNRRRGRPSAT
jgi:short-subunit dehydrogenase